MSKSPDTPGGKKQQVVTAIGLMSGTSLDGIDAALLKTNGEIVYELGPAITLAYTDKERRVLRHAVNAAISYRQRPDVEPQAIITAKELVTEAHARVVEKLLGNVSASEWQTEVIGFHGQTILHRPDEGWTWQIGDGDTLANRLGVTVVDDFRSADMAAGGQGAPLTPLYHRALVRSLEPSEQEPVVILNIGGVANVTWVGPDGQLLAFDTGPGNGLLDDWMVLQSGQSSDWNGEAAVRGQVKEDILEVMLTHKYFSAPPPKSLDRHDFNLNAVNSLNIEDGAATLTRYTARSVAASSTFFPTPPARWLVCGGGRHNPVLMAELAQVIGAPVVTVEDVCWRGDTIEAEAFGLLAVAALRELPLSFPGTTGVSAPTIGGQIHQPGG